MYEHKYMNKCISICISTMFMVAFKIILWRPLGPSWTFLDGSWVIPSKWENVKLLSEMSVCQPTRLQFASNPALQSIFSREINIHREQVLCGAEINIQQRIGSLRHLDHHSTENINNMVYYLYEICITRKKKYVSCKTIWGPGNFI